MQSAGSGKIVVAHPERKAQRALVRLVGATPLPVELVTDVDALIKAVDGDTIAIVDAGIARANVGLCERPARAWIAVPGEGLAPAEPAGIDALLSAGWSHVIAHPMPILAEELLATVQKLIRGDTFGLEKYMTWGAEIRTYALDDTRAREVAVNLMAKDIIAVGLPDRISSMVSVIADELISNAVYGAPVDESGARFRATEARDASRTLADRDAVTVRWATDGRYLAIEVRDRWGSIDPRAIGAKLAAGKQNAAQSEGMGLPLAYACCNQLVIGVAPSQLTEMIALLDVRHKPTELARGASFHAFIGTVGAP
ncbi:MAG: hypothetical protein H0V17_01510 [Deltaproteobacteria bacterium]|nr:hypothetical protein [Deltaproteobacteria bacterium]